MVVMDKRYLTIKGLNKFCEINTEYNWYNEYEDSYLLRRNLDVIANHMLSIQINRNPITSFDNTEYLITMIELKDGWKRRREKSILMGIEGIRDINQFHKRLEEEVNKLLHL
jgi:hypothetical protein